MKFHLDFSFESEIKFNISDKFFLIGSCFSENISNFLCSNCFHFHCNPFGILFDPHSISRALGFIYTNSLLSGDQLIYHENFWYSPYHHGKYYHEDKNELLQIINTSTSVSREKLLKSDVLIITFGTSMAWRHISTNSIYANCHKLPSAQFKREFISTENIIEEWTPLINTLHKTNPDLKIIFSVSPVRYVRQGIVENNISKASLITAVHELCKLKNVSYFPAYEIINDVLRDYRFFKEDMVHPNEQAIKIIWETFTEAYLNKEAKKILTEIEKLNKLISHRPEKKVTQHKSKIMEMINELMKKYPEMSWNNINTR